MVIIVVIEMFGFWCCIIQFGGFLQEDLDTIDRMIADGEATYNKWRHPDPYIGKYCYSWLVVFQESLSLN